MKLKDLKVGMILANDIVVDNTVLVAKGVKITENILNKLKNVYFENNLSVYDLEEMLKKSREKKEELKQVQLEIESLSKELENIFEKIDYKGKADLGEVKDFTKKIMEYLKSPKTIVKNIILQGSGEDCIYKHSVNVTAMSLLLGRWLGFDENKLKLLAYSAILHDFGKTKIDKNILHQKRNLKEDEFKKIKMHPIIAYNLVKDICYLSNSVGYGILMHHERLDGSGYPLGLKDERIHEFAKVIAIVDTFDALNSDRSYKESRDPFKVLEIIKSESLGKLDYSYCNVFIEHLINYYIGEFVLLNNNTVCEIICVNINNLCKPLLMYNGDFIDLKKHNELTVENLIL
ncbi:HD-GYP domain-containing protein [Clostridium tetanomorphum]|uniref:HD-GYP domain-containing protein n=2 Tax=Clostridium tetanomorphum TaxID=1553 RepID=A0A923E9Q2_CLOTT|nr:HD-GYP domain-containing protein [Clostridium tetanomorphum]